jgi:hypothetical protein
MCPVISPFRLEVQSTGYQADEADGRTPLNTIRVVVTMFPRSLPDRRLTRSSRVNSGEFALRIMNFFAAFAGRQNGATIFESVLAVPLLANQNVAAKNSPFDDPRPVSPSKPTTAVSRSNCDDVDQHVEKQSHDRLPGWFSRRHLADQGWIHWCRHWM